MGNLWVGGELQTRQEYAGSSPKADSPGSALRANWTPDQSSAVRQGGVFPGYMGFRGKKAPIHKVLDAELVSSHRWD